MSRDNQDGNARQSGWELSVVSSQCLDRRIPDKASRTAEVAAWQPERNKKHTKFDWRFTTVDARIKLK